MPTAASVTRATRTDTASLRGTRLAVRQDCVDASRGVAGAGAVVLRTIVRIVAIRIQEALAAKIGGMCECLDVSPGWFGPYGGSPSLAEATDAAVFDIDAVLAGQISLSEGIYGAIEDKHCVPYPPQG